MSEKLVSIPFTAGELAPQLFGKTDLQAYQRALGHCENYYVDYKGGISSRAGTAFVDYVKSDTLPTKFIPFRFAPNLANTYMVLFGHQYVRFIQNGAYVLEAAQNIVSITQASPGVVEVTGHGLSNGDWIQISGVGGMTRLNGQRTFIIANVAANTFELLDPFGANYSTIGLPAYTTGGTVSRIYTVVSPYSGSELAELKFDQIRDVLRLTHPDYAVRNLTRASATSWAFTTESFGNYGTEPGVPSVTVNSASGGTTTGSAEALYAVSAVDVNGQESLPSVLLRKTTMAMYLDDPDLTATISWTGVSGTSFYRVYRSRVVNHVGGITKGDALGLIGETAATSFTDDDSIPDFTRTPVYFDNPFAHGAVLDVAVTAGGSGYAVTDTISISGGGGSGFRAELIVIGGVIKAVEIVNPGSGYSSPTVTITAGGSGATFSVTLSESSGRNPYTSAIFQQRQMYAGLDVEPLSIFGSRVGYLSNFSTSVVLNDADGLHYELESPVVVAIRHMVPTNEGLVVFAKDGLWFVNGGSEPAITPTNVLAQHFPSEGAASALAPLVQNAAILYLEDASARVRLLDFDQPNAKLGGQDISVLSNHFFKSDNQVTSWGFASAPHSLVWAAREDGTFLSFTLQPEHEIYAWTQHSTAGLVTDVATLEENDADSVYFMVQRYVNARWTKFIERMLPRVFTDVETYWGVDCGLTNARTYPAAILTPGAATGTGISFEASAGVFAVGDVGKVIRGGGGAATITGYSSATVVTATITRDFTKLVPQTGRPVPIPSGEWTMDATFSTLAGLDHLEGETVKVLLDGKPLADKTVASGSISLGTSGSLAIVGKGYRCKGQTLPITQTVDDRRKRPVGLAFRQYESAGLKVGDSLSRLYEGEERISANLGTLVDLTSEYRAIKFGSTWNADAALWFVQDYPLPSTLLGLVFDTEIGDDSN